MHIYSDVTGFENGVGAVEDIGGNAAVTEPLELVAVGFTDVTGFENGVGAADESGGNAAVFEDDDIICCVDEELGVASLSAVSVDLNMVASDEVKAFSSILPELKPPEVVADAEGAPKLKPPCDDGTAAGAPKLKAPVVIDGVDPVVNDGVFEAAAGADGAPKLNPPLEAAADDDTGGAPKLKPEPPDDALPPTCGAVGCSTSGRGDSHAMHLYFALTSFCTEHTSHLQEPVLAWNNAARSDAPALPEAAAPSPSSPSPWSSPSPSSDSSSPSNNHDTYQDAKSSK